MGPRSLVSQQACCMTQGASDQEQSDSHRVKQGRATREGHRGPRSPRSNWYQQQSSSTPWAAEVTPYRKFRHASPGLEKGTHREHDRNDVSAIHIRKSLAVIWGEGLCACTNQQVHVQHWRVSQTILCVASRHGAKAAMAEWGGCRQRGWHRQGPSCPEQKQKAQSPRRLNRKGSELRIAS